MHNLAAARPEEQHLLARPKGNRSRVERIMLPKVGSRTAAPRRFVAHQEAASVVSEQRCQARRLLSSERLAVPPQSARYRQAYAGFTPTREKTFERLAMTGTNVPENVSRMRELAKPANYILR
jgi:hypothetical protein